MTMKKIPAKTISLRGIASYPFLFTPKYNELKRENQYSIDLLIDKSSDLSQVKVLIDDMVTQKYGSIANKPENFKSFIKDGDLKKDKSPEYANKLFITCTTNSKNKVTVCDAGRNILSDSTSISGGDTVVVNMNLSLYDTKGNKGISAYLNGVQLLKKTDKPFSGRVSNPEEMFSDESLAEDDKFTAQNSSEFSE